MSALDGVQEDLDREDDAPAATTQVTVRLIPCSAVGPGMIFICQRCLAEQGIMRCEQGAFRTYRGPCACFYCGGTGGISNRMLYVGLEPAQRRRSA